MKHWRLKSKEERRFKLGHPWVYSNELQESPKGIQAGEVVELNDSGGGFLAYGFGNPNSLISFRVLSREKNDLLGSDPKTTDELVQSILAKNLERAFKFRLHWFSLSQSFRLVYGENDDLPGLVIDRYVGAETIYVIQPHSAGMDRHLSVLVRGLADLSKKFEDPVKTKIIYRRDAGSREREGLSKQTTEVYELQTLKKVEDLEPYKNFVFQLQSFMGREVSMGVDLISGQKTGFFFDQAQNTRMVQLFLIRKFRYLENNDIKAELLDLCSYVGQWSVQLAQAYLEKRIPLKITAVDASESALKFAEENIRRNSICTDGSKVQFEKLKADVLEPMRSLPDRHYDVVIADPPAFIKNRKSIPQGKHAYVQLFTTAIIKTASNGLVVCCSCSQLLSSEDFKECLQKAVRRSGRTVRWIAQGSPSIDHFIRMEFEEGHYLKCWVGMVE